ncbi:heme utilization cystosolic carrier protein HutX [Chelatococcus sp. SYSU_G07232]|uniref:Heme utilization cystosolic carrier protein HutX n=1 Tax=Chelatococcus albus TaxID=3047466 RepID=A0ABT7AL17_9HYPH|nr:heme utilization cystosolic carrier protein HutX [Chelatococcus sp. SYSU_G07232]MDJ1160071.1 heme utilization cystosolic carrier protein HutX [Chelatococcus sp. SYSU_G07232]
MSNTTQAADDRRASLARRLAENPDGVIETLARDHGVTTLEATRMLPSANCSWAPATAFADIFKDIATWGDVLFLVHTPNIVLECVGPVPRGEFGRGFFNLHGDGPIGGHIKADRCSAIAFVRRPFMGLDSCSIQFFDEDGAAMFKIFVRRRPDRSLDASQVRAFQALAAQFAATAS